MRALVALLFLGMGWSLPAPTLEDVRIDAPAGWPVWLKGAQHAVFLGPEPEVEETMLSYSSCASTSPRVTLDGHVRAAMDGRLIVRVSPVHDGTTADGLAWLAQVVISEDGAGVKRHTFVAVVQGVRRAVLVHYETGREEMLSQYFGVLREAVGRVRFGE